MPRRRSEPRCLRRGKTFHRKVQADWLRTAKGQVQVEKTIRALGRRTGRMDVFAEGEDSEVRAILEVKATDWDQKTVAAG